MQTYHFITKWFFKAPIVCVWQELVDFEAWPTWWKGWQKVVQEGPEKTLRVRARGRVEARGFLPYTLRFNLEVTRLERPVKFDIRSSGDLVGSGRFELEDRDGGTYVTFFWDVGTTNPLLNAIGGLGFAKMLMEINHDYIMENGYRSLKLRLEGSGARFPQPVYHW